jgi:uncharacterized protein YqgV (UPF0045/DUF77 family)
MIRCSKRQFPFCIGQGELSGAVDLLAHHGLGDYYELFCKRPFPHTLQASKYVRNVLSESDIQKGEGMELEQVLTRADDEVSRSNLKIQELPMETLYEAFNLRESSLRLLPKVSHAIKSPNGKKVFVFVENRCQIGFVERNVNVT